MPASVLFLMFATAVGALAQAFNSGSSGADRMLELTAPGTVVFDPAAFNPPLNVSGDNVYHFSYVHIGKGVTLKLSSSVLHGPVFWLVQGPVQIDGIIDLNGKDGERFPSVAGPGGYAGGGIGKAGYGLGSTFTPNGFLVPLVGGDGGAGGEKQGGGAGGGALLIASSISISVSGSITANGGSSMDGTGGNGGAIRLVAPLIDGLDGQLSAKGGKPQGADGRIRFETFEHLFTGNLNETPFSFGKPFGLFLPPPPPSARIVSVGSVAITSPEISVKQAGSLPVAVEARNVPAGTVVALQCFAEDGSDRTVKTNPLEGSLERSIASAVMTFQSGSSHCYAQANWTQPEIITRKP